MEVIWKIVLSETAKGKFQVKIDGIDGSSIGKGNTPHKAYKDAECKLVIKPWLTSTGE